MKKIIAGITALAISIVLVGLPTQSVEAAIQEYINTNDGNYYIYDKNTLLSSYNDYIIDENSTGSVVFKHFLNNFKTVAVIDDKEGKIVDYKKLIEVYTDYVLTDRVFNPNAYTESTEAVAYESLPAQVKRVSISNTNELVITDEAVTGSEVEFKVLSIE